MLKHLAHLTFWLVTWTTPVLGEELFNYSEATGYKYVFVDIPLVLEPDPAQQSSVVSPGEWYPVGDVKLSGDQVRDPELDKEIEDEQYRIGALAHDALDDVCDISKRKGGTYCSESYIDALEELTSKDLDVVAEACSSSSTPSSDEYWGDDHVRFDLYNDLIREHCDSFLSLLADKEKGYLLTRHQRYESVSGAGWTVNSNDTQIQTASITLGYESFSQASIAETTGWTFGTETTQATSANMSLGVEFSGASLGGGVESSESITDSRELSEELQINFSRSSLANTTRTTSVEFTMKGCAPGARYVMWQIVDWLKLSRVHDKSTVSNAEILSAVQTQKYYFGNVQDPSCDT